MSVLLPAFIELPDGLKSVDACSLPELRAAEQLTLSRRKTGEDYPGDDYLRGIRTAITLRLDG